MSESTSKKPSKIYFRGTPEELERCHVEAGRRGFRSLDAFVRAATELYLALPAGLDDEIRLYGRFFELATPEKREQIRGVLEGVIRDWERLEAEAEDKTAELTDAELEAALERRRRRREQAAALEKLRKGE